MSSILKCPRECSGRRDYYCRLHGLILAIVWGKAYRNHPCLLWELGLSTGWITFQEYSDEKNWVISIDIGDGIVVGDGKTAEEAYLNFKSAVRFHKETFSDGEA